MKKQLVNRRNILAAGLTADMKKTVTDQFQPGNLVTATGVEEAIEKYQQDSFDIVIIGETIGPADERKLRKIVSVQDPGVIFINAAGNETMVVALIHDAAKKLDELGKARLSFTDNAFQHAGLNIVIQ